MERIAGQHDRMPGSVARGAERPLENFRTESRRIEECPSLDDLCQGCRRCRGGGAAFGLPGHLDYLEPIPGKQGNPDQVSAGRAPGSSRERSLGRVGPAGCILQVLPVGIASGWHGLVLETAHPQRVKR